MGARRILGWTLAGGAAGYAASWLVTSAAMLLLSERARAGVRRVPAPGVAKFARVDARVWRGAAPTAEGRRWLRAQGVRTIVDLRAETPAQAGAGAPPPDVRGPGPSPPRIPTGDARPPSPEPADAHETGMSVVRIPILDGRAPSAGQVRRFLDVVADARRPVFVHCGAGVGRTGAMVAAYLVGTGRARAAAAARRSLAFGPPTLEQYAFMRGLDGPAVRRPPRALVVFSRIADSPRRARARVRGM